MRFTDRYASLLGGSLRTLVKRESDRRRFAGSAFEWLFHPYLGEELVALAFRFSQDSEILSIAAVVFDQRQVYTRSAWVATLADEARIKRRRQRPSNDQHCIARHCIAQHRIFAPLPPTAENIAALAEFIGNRPVVGWGLGRALAPINRLFNARLGFELPNAQVDVARLYQRKARRSPVEPQAASFSQALSHSRLALPWPSLLGEASACALLYMRLKRDAALEV
ncbi:DNA polymerase III subunit epsilon [Vreelandella sp. GE22]